MSLGRDVAEDALHCADGALNIAPVVRQLQTDTRMQRLPRHVVPPKKASPVAAIRPMVSSVLRSRSWMVAPGRRSRKRTRPWLIIGSQTTCAPGRPPMRVTRARAWAQVRSIISAIRVGATLCRSERHGRAATNRGSSRSGRAHRRRTWNSSSGARTQCDERPHRQQRRSRVFR